MSEVRTVQVGFDTEAHVVVLATTDEEALAKARDLLADWLAPTSVLKVVAHAAEHSVVGHTFRGTRGVCRCIAYDWRTGFWMRDDTQPNPDNRWDVSERAIGRTYHYRSLP
jgi:hypothetical protein